MKEIKILVVESNKKPYTLGITNLQKTLYGLIYYPYLKIQIQKDIFLIYSKEADKLQNDVTFKKNISINNIEIYGTFVIIKSQNNQATSLTAKEIKELEDYLLLLQDQEERRL